MFKRVMKTGFILGVSLSCGVAAAVEEQLAEAPSLDAELTDMVTVDSSYYDESGDSLLSNSQKTRNAAAAGEGTLPPAEAVSAQKSRQEQPAGDNTASAKADVGSTDETSSVKRNADEADVTSEKSSQSADVRSDADQSVVKTDDVAETKVSDGSVKAEPENVPSESDRPAEDAGTPSSVTEKKSDESRTQEVKTAEAADNTASVNETEQKKTEREGSDNKKAVVEEKQPALPEKSADASVSDGISESADETSVKAKEQPDVNDKAQPSEGAAGDSSVSSANSADSRTIYDILRRRQQEDFENPNLYTRDYLSEMYLPYFYNTYELPQELSPYITLRTVRLDKKGPVLVYDIGTADALGPMDFDGTPEDNKTLNLFCRIALNEGILHRLDRIVLVFYHDDRDYSEVSLDYLKCTGKEPLLVEKSVLSHESLRQDDEFIYAYEAEPEGPLSAEYLRKRFAPFALKRIGEKFDAPEGHPVMSATDDASLMVLFSVPSKHVNRVKQADFVAGRIDRTCSIDTYGKWILPRINELRYVYLEDKTDKVIKEVVVTDKACRAVRSRLKR
ncbi:hypothetical protein [uncultured Ruminobacter sp.]|uniref:hypothetical protein n=1 Tax=uncultured Ruminobacter sp. TaxID=538947 RepID=UPI0025D2A6A7|nr:hypothetical protein [uncultured Ruminobacter sp.]